MKPIKSYALPPDKGLAPFGEPTKASAESTGGAMTLIRSETVGGAPWHIHSREDEAFYVLSGTIRVWHGTEIADLGPGGFVFLPRRVPHQWDTQGPASLLLITVPAMLETFLAEFHEANADRAAVASRYGVAFLPEDFDPGAGWDAWL